MADRTWPETLAAQRHYGRLHHLKRIADMQHDTDSFNIGLVKQSRAILAGPAFVCTWTDLDDTEYLAELDEFERQQSC